MSKLRLTTLANQGDTLEVPSETVIAGSAKAWVTFDGTGTVDIKDSFNVSSITDNGVGDYTINFTESFSDVNYCAVTGVGLGTPGVGDGIQGAARCYGGAAEKTITSHRIITPDNNGTAIVDANHVNACYLSN